MNFLKKPDGSFSFGKLLALLSGICGGVATAGIAPSVTASATALSAVLGGVASTVH